MAPPSLLFVNQHYWPDVASTGQHLTDLAEYLVADGFDVTVWCSQARYLGGGLTAPRREIRNGVHIRRLPSTGFGREGLAGRAADYLSFYAGVFGRLVTGRRYDRVVFLTTPSILSFVGYMARKLRRQPYGVWSMDLHPEIEEALGIFREGRRFTRLLHAASLAGDGGADFVVDLGPWMKRRLLSRGIPEERLHTIPVWNRKEEIYPVPQEENALARELGLGDRYIVMYSGNAGLAHRFAEVLEAMRRLRNDPDIFFLFVGGGPRKSEILEHVERHRVGNFRYLDYFPRERLHESLSLGDVHLLTLRNDMAGLAVPGKLYGIMAAGRPVVMVGPEASEHGELIAGGGVGHLVDPEAEGQEAPARLVEILLRLKDDADRRKSMGRRARELFLHEYEREVCCRRWADLLRARLASDGRKQGGHWIGGDQPEAVPLDEPEARATVTPCGREDGRLL